jgi:hypothetical protein
MITKRDHQGHFYPSRQLEGDLGGRSYTDVPQASLGAYGGRWWAVWEQAGEPGSAQLFQAKTFGVAEGPTQITAGADDSRPSISVDANGAVLAWTRAQDELGPSSVPSSVWVAVETGSTLQRARRFSTTGTSNVNPDVRRISGLTLLSWTSDGKTVEADNWSGSFRSHRFLTGGAGSKIGTTPGSVSVAWTTAAGRVFLARGAKGSGVFTGQYLTGPGTLLQALVTAHVTDTAFVASAAQVYSLTG